MRYFLDPFVFEDPQSKREIYRQHQRRQSNRCDSRPQYHPSPSMGCWDPILMMDAIAHSHTNQQDRRQKRDQEPSCKRFQGDGLDFLVLPPEALQGGVKSRNPFFKGRTGIRKPCQVPSPSPTSKAPPATPEKSTTKPAVDRYYELLFGGGAPSDRSQRQDPRRSAKKEQTDSKSLDDELFGLFFPGAKPRAHRQQQQELRQEALNQAILQKELDQRSAALASRRQQQVRRQQSYEQAMQEAILRSMFGQQPNTMTRKEASNPTGEHTNEQKKSDRNVTFATNSTSAYQLPQQWHTEATGEGFVLSIDVTGFAMDDLNLHVDPTRSGSAQLNLTGKRTNALGEVWELKRSKSLNAERYQINAVEAICQDDNILRICIPKKVEPTTSQVYIPIRPSATNNEQEEKANTEDAKPFTHFARSSEATRDTKAESKAEGGDEAKDEAPITLEELLQATADQFERAYHESTHADPDMTLRESETKEQVDDNKEIKLSTGIETKKETPKEKSEVTLKTSPTFDAEDVAVKSETEENMLPESKPERLVEEPQKKRSSDEATSTAEPITEKAEDDRTAETEIVWSRIGFESTREDTAAAKSLTDHARNAGLVDDEDSNVEKNQPKSDEFFDETEDIVEKFGNPRLNRGESFDILESEDAEDNQSWEDIDGFEREA